MLACELRLELNVAFSTIQPTHVVMCNFVYPNYKVIPEKSYKKQTIQILSHIMELLCGLLDPVSSNT